MASGVWAAETRIWLLPTLLESGSIVFAAQFCTQIRQLKKTPGAWPPEFGDGPKASPAHAQQVRLSWEAAVSCFCLP